MGEFLDLKTCILFVIIALTTISAILSMHKNMKIHQKQEAELSMYRIYVKPLEELIKEIRAKQHEFDNHMNAILNMHITIHDYETLIAKQANYIKGIVKERDQSFIHLLCISDKVLAGFIYSKLNAVKDRLQIDLNIGSRDIIVQVPEYDLIEIVGTFIDNAIEACTKEKNRIIFFLSSEEDKLLFEIKNEHHKIPIKTLTKFFEMGYTTKEDKEKHGFGLYHAKRIIEQFNGEVFVENEEIDGVNFISFRVEV